MPVDPRFEHFDPTLQPAAVGTGDEGNVLSQTTVVTVAPTANDDPYAIGESGCSAATVIAPDSIATDGGGGKAPRYGFIDPAIWEIGLPENGRLLTKDDDPLAGEILR